MPTSRSPPPYKDSEETSPDSAQSDDVLKRLAQLLGELIAKRWLKQHKQREIAETERPARPKE